MASASPNSYIIIEHDALTGEIIEREASPIEVADWPSPFASSIPVASTDGDVQS